MDFSTVSFLQFQGWSTEETFEAEAWAVVEQQYLPKKVPVPVQHMAIFYHSVADTDRDVFKLPILGTGAGLVEPPTLPASAAF